MTEVTALGMTKARCIELWGLDPDSPETERVWADKIALDARVAGGQGFEAHMVQPDLQPYKSMVDGSMITSRSQHRDHLKQHGMIEIGNEINHHMKQPEKKVDREGIREAIAQSLNQHRR